MVSRQRVSNYKTQALQGQPEAKPENSQNSAVLYLPEHCGDIIARMRSTTLKPHMSMLFRQGSKLAKTLQQGPQGSGHVTTTVASVNPDWTLCSQETSPMMMRSIDDDGSLHSLSTF